MTSAFNVPLASLAGDLEAENEVWVRLAATRSDGEWALRLLEVTTGEPPPNWTALRWEYPDAVLVASVKSGAQVARWLPARKARVLRRSVTLPLPAAVSWDRRESHWSGGVAYAPLPWPSVCWQLPRSSAAGQAPQDVLVAERSPSFVSFDAAAASLLGVELTGWSMSGREFVVRRQDHRGRVTRIRIGPTELRVHVEGRALRGAVVELAGNQPGPIHRLTSNRPRTISFPLPSGVPDGSWVLLRKGAEWLDRRFLTWPYAQQQQQQPGVEIEVEPTTRLDALVGRGEGPTTECKLQMPADDDEGKRRVMKTVAAFANGDGGSILFGVSDELQVVGLSQDESSARARDRLALLLNSWVSPVPTFAIDVVQAPDVDDRWVVILTVERGDHPPYAAGTQPTNYIYYVRRAGNSIPIGPSEVAALLRSRVAAEQARLPQTRLR